MGIILYIIATFLWVILTPINWVIVSIKHGISNNYFLETATDIDKFGNRNFRAFLNATMLKKDVTSIIEPIKFGNVTETISSVLGKNQRDNSLSFFGKIIVKILDTIEKNHCKNSIEQ